MPARTAMMRALVPDRDGRCAGSYPACVGSARRRRTGEWWGHQRRAIANLRTDSPETIYQALATLDLPPVPPSDADLARRFGDFGNRQAHTRFGSVRRMWLDRRRNEAQILWLPWF